MANAYVQSAAPAKADGLKRGDLWVDTASGNPVVKVCVQVDPAVRFVELGREKLAAVADVATANADATYGQPEADLINELKTQVNLALARLRTAGIIS